MKSKKIIILLILSNIILIGIIFKIISRDVNIIKERQVIKKMDETTQVTDLNNQITALEASHTQYANYIQTCKTMIATALTNEKVTTSDQETLETMAENIGKVLQARTSDATATADNITEGKTAYVNGELITGTGGDNKSNYDNGYTEGQQEEITITYSVSNNEGGYLFYFIPTGAKRIDITYTNKQYVILSGEYLSGSSGTVTKELDTTKSYYFQLAGNGTTVSGNIYL